MPELPRMVVVGAGECGLRAALAVREAGHNGPVTLIGAEPHHAYERPPLSKGWAVDGEGPRAPRYVSDDAALAAVGIAFLKGVEAVVIDRTAKAVRLADGRSVAYDRLLLATGAEPRRLALSGLDPARCLVLRTHEDAEAIGSHLRPGTRLAIIGGGFIGLELAASARLHGADVTVIEAAPRVMMRGVPAEIATAVAARHEAEGVRLMTGAAIAGAETGAAGVTLRLADGTEVAADLVVAGIGASPRTALAEGAGLRVDNGIAVDATLRTGDPDIFAAGDCCSFPLALYGGRRIRLEAWRNAQEQGPLAARNMLGANEAVSSVPWFWSDQFDLSLQIAGLVDEGATTVRRDLGDGAFLLFHVSADGRLVAASGLGKGNVVARDIRLAEMLIAKAARPNPARLAAPDQKLKALLAA